jgi:DNA-binding response OmpR family regulator
MFRILLVESDLTICNTISRILSGLGYGLDVAYDAAEARALANRHRYNLGLFGDRLSDGDGVQLFEEVRQLQQKMAGVLVTAVGNLYTVSKAIGAGMLRVLCKPLDFGELVALISFTAEATNDEHARMAPERGRAMPFTEEKIAELTPRDIQYQLSERDLVEIIRSVDYPFAGKERLEFFDRDTLERVVHLVRRWCRNRLQLTAW